MRALTEDQIKSSFVNASADEVARLKVPNLATTPWDDLDFLGWVDPATPAKGWLVLPKQDAPLGIMLRIPTNAMAPRRSMCNLCHSVQPRGGVRLMTAPREGEAGLRHNMVGTYICADLACSLYIRGLKPLQGFAQLPESVSELRRIRRLRQAVDDFVARVLDPEAPVTPDPVTAEG